MKTCLPIEMNLGVSVNTSRWMDFSQSGSLWETTGQSIAETVLKFVADLCVFSNVFCH